MLVKSLQITLLGHTIKPLNSLSLIRNCLTEQCTVVLPNCHNNSLFNKIRLQFLKPPQISKISR